MKEYLRKRISRWRKKVAFNVLEELINAHISEKFSSGKTVKVLRLPTFLKCLFFAVDDGRADIKTINIYESDFGVTRIKWADEHRIKKGKKGKKR